MKVPGILDSSIELLDSVFVLDYARTIRCTRCLTLGKLADRYFEFLELGLRICLGFRYSNFEFDGCYPTSSMILQLIAYESSPPRTSLRKCGAGTV
jgi:hypothetical protein